MCESAGSFTMLTEIQAEVTVLRDDENRPRIAPTPDVLLDCDGAAYLSAASPHRKLALVPQQPPPGGRLLRIVGGRGNRNVQRREQTFVLARLFLVADSFDWLHLLYLQQSPARPLPQTELACHARRKDRARS